jgi:hypothetical protein
MEIEHNGKNPENQQKIKYIFAWMYLRAAKFTFFHVIYNVNSREKVWIFKISHFFTKSLFLPANNAKIASHGLFHNKSFVLKTIHVIVVLKLTVLTLINVN